MAISSNWHQLKQSWLRQNNAADSLEETHAISSSMVRFYSIECGLKGVLVKDLRLRDVTDLDNFRSHDLRYFVKQLKLPRTFDDALHDCRPRGRSGTPIKVAELHQAWRYGQLLDADDETLTVTGLKSIHEWCITRLGKA